MKRKLIEALKFYADAANWGLTYPPDHKVLADDGAIARAALQEYDAWARRRLRPLTNDHTSGER